jgi:hypothetical protein
VVSEPPPDAVAEIDELPIPSGYRKG